MKPLELVNLIKKERPGLLGTLPEKRAARIILEALVQLGKQLNATKEGVVKIPRFGNFRVRPVEREKNGEKTTVRLITFRAAKKK